MTQLSLAEKEILEHLAQAWKLWCLLPDNRSYQNEEQFLRSIHHAQQIIAPRVAKRVDPEIWPHVDVGHCK